MRSPTPLQRSDRSRSSGRVAPKPRLGRGAAYGILLIALATGCETATGAEWERQIGRLQIDLSSVQVVQAPATARVGEAVRITVTTVGSSNCTRAAGAELAVAGTVHEIVPYDLRAVSGIGCRRDIQGYPRTLTLEFEQPGSYTIRVRGAPLSSVPPDVAMYEAPITITC